LTCRERRRRRLTVTTTEGRGEKLNPRTPTTEGPVAQLLGKTADGGTEPPHETGKTRDSAEDRFSAELGGGKGREKSEGEAKRMRSTF